MHLKSIFEKIHLSDHAYQKINRFQWLIATVNAIIFVFVIYVIARSELFQILMTDWKYLFHVNIWGVSKFIYVLGFMLLTLFALVLIMIIAEDGLKIIIAKKRSDFKKTPVVDLFSLTGIVFTCLLSLFLFPWWNKVLIANGNDWALFWATDFEFASISFNIMTLAIYFIVSLYCYKALKQIFTILVLIVLLLRSHIDFDFKGTVLLDKGSSGLENYKKLK